MARPDPNREIIGTVAGKSLDSESIYSFTIRVVPASWVRESTTAYSVADGNVRDHYSGGGYLWWVAVNGNHYPKVDLPDGSFSAWGAGGHFIAVIPAFNLVVVHRVNTDDPAKKVTLEQFGELLHLILAAKNK